MVCCEARAGRGEDMKANTAWQQRNVGFCAVRAKEPRQLSRYGDWLLAGRPRGRSSSPHKVKNFHFSASSRPGLGYTQLPIL
jgi:hypothetical protein